MRVPYTIEQLETAKSQILELAGAETNTFAPLRGVEAS
jgi:hypothetical protein